MERAVANGDAMLVNWKLHLPREKQSVVDKNEEVDELMFHAHNLLQGYVCSSPRTKLKRILLTKR